MRRILLFSSVLFISCDIPTFEVDNPYDPLVQAQIEDYKLQIKLKDDMIQVVKPKWYENKYIWFGLGVVFTSGGVYLAGQL